MPQRTLTEVFADYDPISFTDQYIVVQERAQTAIKLAQAAAEVDYRELGATGSSIYGRFREDEYNPTLRGQAGLKKYDEMRRSDAQVRASLRLLKTPVLAGKWNVQPASQSVRDTNAAEFVRRCIWEFMSISWNDILTNALLMLDFGYFCFEKVWEERYIDGQRRIVWKKLSPRHPMDIQEWKYDERGGPAAIVMEPYDPFRQPEIEIPIDKLLVFTNEREAGNIQGTSALRSAYKHFYFKDNLYKIDAIQKERHGIGVPVIKLPPNFNKLDAQLADEIGRNLRVNEKAHVVLPPMWELEFAKLEGNPVDAVTSIEHHNRMISVNVLGGFIEKTSSGDDKSDHEIFLKASRYIADQVRDVFNKYAIPQLIDFNFERVGYPQLIVRRVGEVTDWRTLSFAIRNMIGADVLRSDDDLEDWARDEMDLPLKDKETDRAEDKHRLDLELQEAQIDALENPPIPAGGSTTSNGTNRNRGAQAGLPRQSSRPPVGTGSKRTGGPSNNSA